MKAGLYVRVSTDSQVEGYSIDAQKEMLLNYIKIKGYHEHKFYIDGGYSGKDLNRPNINKLINDIECGIINCVIVFKLDRISRSQRDTIYLIEEVFNKYNVGFISIKENFDTTTPFGKAMIGILSVFAQLERETILERTKIGIQKRAEAGLWRGGGKIPFAYDYDKSKGILIPNKKRVEILKKMIELYIDGLSFRKIGSVFGIDESTVERIILNKTNIGYVPYKGTYYPGKHQGVIANELYERIIMINKMRKKSRTSRRYLLSGKIFCGKCGAKYRYQKWGKKIICYCYSKQMSKPKYVKDPNCNNKNYESYELENCVLESIFDLRIDFKLINYDNYIINKKDEYENRINIINKKISNLLNNICNNIAVDITNDKIKKLEDEIKLVRELIRNECDDKINNPNSFRDIWGYLSFDEKKIIIEILIDKIVIEEDRVNIYYNYSI